MLNKVLNRTFTLASSLYADFKEFLAPSACLCCGRDRDFEDLLLCPQCQDSLRRANPGGGPICPFCSRPSGAISSCQFCAKSGALDLFFWGNYDGNLKECLLKFKFHGAIELGRRLAQMAVDALQERITSNSYDIIIPVPLYKAREKERLYNQSDIIATELSRLLKVETRTDLLVRIKPTRQQAKLDEGQRWNNVRDAFVVLKGVGDQINGKRVLLVDDIVTTGATIHEASKPLIEAGARRLDIFSVAYAR